eukprot:3483451-Pyramimonas_sp.AAC.1
MDSQECCSPTSRCDVLEDITGPKDVAGAKERIVDSALSSALPPHSRRTHADHRRNEDCERLARCSAPSLTMSAIRQRNEERERFILRPRAASTSTTSRQCCIDETNWMFYWAGVLVNGKCGQCHHSRKLADLSKKSEELIDFNTFMKSQGHSDNWERESLEFLRLL